MMSSTFDLRVFGSLSAIFAGGHVYGLAVLFGFMALESLAEVFLKDLKKGLVTTVDGAADKVVEAIKDGKK